MKGWSFFWQVWRVNGQEKILLPASDQSKIYSGDCYIFQYSYPGEDKEEQLIGTWFGKQSIEVIICQECYLFGIMIVLLWFSLSQFVPLALWTFEVGNSFNKFLLKIIVDMDKYSMYNGVPHTTQKRLTKKVKSKFLKLCKCIAFFGILYSTHRSNKNYNLTAKVFLQKSYIAVKLSPEWKDINPGTVCLVIIFINLLVYLLANGGKNFWNKDHSFSCWIRVLQILACWQCDCLRSWAYNVIVNYLNHYDAQLAYSFIGHQLNKIITF